MRAGLWLALALLPGLAAGRMWTSVTGARVEAEFEAMNGEFVVLRRADGRRLQIGLAKLSAADQAFAQSQATEATVPAGTPPIEGSGEAAQPPTVQAEGQTPLFGAYSRAQAQTLETEEFPGLDLRSAAETTFLGLQYGPGPGDVVYFAFDTEGFGKRYDRLFIYSPTLPAFRTTVNRRASTRSIDESRVSCFRDVVLQARFDDLSVTYDVEFFYGLDRVSVLGVTIDVVATRAGKATKFLLSGFLNENLLVAGGTIEPRPILGRPELDAVARRHGRGLSLGGHLTMGGLRLFPGTGMERNVQLVIEDNNGRTRARERVRFDDEKLFAPMRGPDLRMERPELKPATAHIIKASIDLGPLFGPLAAARDFTSPAEE